MRLLLLGPAREGLAPTWASAIGIRKAGCSRSMGERGVSALFSSLSGSPFGRAVAKIVLVHLSAIRSVSFSFLSAPLGQEGRIGIIQFRSFWGGRCFNHFSFRGKFFNGEGWAWKARRQMASRSLRYGILLMCARGAR